MKRSAALLLAAVSMACGGTAPQQPATIQQVSLKAADLPRGMVVCGLSGDVDRFLSQAPSNNQYATEIQQNWEAIKTMGVQHGVVEVYAKSKADCGNLFTSSTAQALPAALCMTIEFKNGSQATKAYGNVSEGASGLIAMGAQQGTATGLGKNSLAFADQFSGQSIYFALWQNARFINVLLGEDLGVPASQRAAKNVNSRVH
ncbi:MAG TPA: hypothetical protein VF137_03655 [Candidatus Dormibacteraeota bacterium]